MHISSFDDDDPSAADLPQRAAEQVRRYLVTVRGGAPFLSGTDAQLLSAWLSQGVPVADILAAIDRVAARRRRRPPTTRLSLSACKAEVKRRPGGAPAPVPAAPEDDPVGRLLSSLPDAPALTGLRGALGALRGDAGPPAGRAAAAIALAAQFLEGEWERADRAELRARAAARLGPLRGLVPDAEFEELLEEAARDELRRSWPDLTATAIWTAFGGTP